jgi:hypothetical protein
MFLGDIRTCEAAEPKELRELCNGESHNLCSSPDSVSEVKPLTLRWTECMTHVGETKNVFKICLGKLFGKKPRVRIVLYKSV